jgi:hypothetical protein
LPRLFANDGGERSLCEFAISDPKAAWVSDDDRHAAVLAAGDRHITQDVAGEQWPVRVHVVAPCAIKIIGALVGIEVHCPVIGLM